MARILRQLSTMLCVGLLACGDPLGPLLDVASVELQFDLITERCAEDVAARQHVVEGHEGRISLSGVYMTANGGWELTPIVAAPTRGEILVTVQGSWANAGLAIPICHLYEIGLSEIPTGTYEVKLVHSDVTFDTSQTVSHTRVRVR